GNSQVSRGEGGVGMLVPATGNDKSTGDDILLARYADSPARTLVAANLPTEGTDYLGLGLLNQRGGAASLSISDAPTHIPWASPSLNRLQSAAPTEIRLQPAQTIDEIISGLHTYSRLMVNDMLAAVSGNDATFVSQSVPTTLVAGQQYTVTVQMQNTGATTWTAAN